MDELSLGLAPQVTRRLLRAVRSVADAGMAVLLVEQHVDQALSVADRAYVLAQGEVVFDGSAAQLREDPVLVGDLYLGRR